jgi:hypothetical protein
MSGGMTATPNDDGTVTVSRNGSELDFTPEMVEASDSFTKGEKNFLFEMFLSASPSTGGGSCRI